MQFSTIITHEYPDLDAMLCCYLLKCYGASRYPGMEKAKIEFYPAGRLPNNKTPEELEKEGILAVDIGGGRLDTHPDGSTLDRQKRSLSAANLVAQDLGVDQKNTLQSLLEFTRLQDSTGQSLQSRNPVDHAMALPNIIKGGLIYFGNRFGDMTEFFIQVFAAIEAACMYSSFSLRPVEVLERINLKKLLASYLSQKYADTLLPGKHFSPDDFENFLQNHGLRDQAECKKLIAFIQNLKPNHYLLGSSTPIDQSVSLPNIILGLYYLKAGDMSHVSQCVFLIFDCILAHEKDWQDAFVEYKAKRKLYEIGKMRLVAIEAERGSVVKAARWHDKADVILYKDALLSNISITINKLGMMKNTNFRRLAAKLRLAEILCGYRLEKPLNQTELCAIGEIAGWFLHQSEKLLVHGSPKARRDPSLISFEDITEMLITEWDLAKKLPEKFCPVHTCLQRECPFFELRLRNCFHHRENLRTNPLPKKI